MDKSSRIGIRVSPGQKAAWELASEQWGYKSLSSWITAMLNWSIAYEAYDGDYDAYLKDNDYV